MDISNAIIRKSWFDTERGLTGWIETEHEGGHQCFGGYVLYAPEGWVAHESPGNFAGHFIWRVLEIAGADDWSKLAGKTIRVRHDHSKIEAIGHIIKDDWFDPSVDFKKIIDKHGDGTR